MKTYLDARVLVHRQRFRIITPGIRWAHAGPDGRPLLRWEVSWRTISGVMLAVGRTVVWLYVRRRPAWKRRAR